MTDSRNDKDGKVLPNDDSKIPPSRRTDSIGTLHHVGPVSEIAAELRQKAEYPTVGPQHTRIIPVRLLESAANNPSIAAAALSRGNRRGCKERRRGGSARLFRDRRGIAW